MRKLLNGHILVRFDTDMITETEHGLRMAVDFDPEFNQGVTGTVLKVCEEQFINRDWHPKVRVDCQEGDRVIMHYMGCQTALECGINNKHNGTWYYEDGHFYAVINYAFVMAFERDGVLNAAPGYILARRVAKSKKNLGWVTIEEEPNEEIMFQVVYVGEDIVSRPGTDQAHGIEPGDVVLTDYNCAYELEQPNKMYILKEELVCFDKYLIYATLN